MITVATADGNDDSEHDRMQDMAMDRNQQSGKIASVLIFILSRNGSSPLSDISWTQGSVTSFFWIWPDSLFIPYLSVCFFFLFFFSSFHQPHPHSFQFTMPIQKIHARQIFDSRGNPTVEVEVTTGKGKSTLPSTLEHHQYPLSPK